MSAQDKSLTLAIVNSNVPVKVFPGDRVRLVRAVGPDQADITLGDIYGGGSLRKDGQVLLDDHGGTWLIMNGHWQVLDVIARAPRSLPTESNSVVSWRLNDSPESVDTAQLLAPRWYIIGESESLTARELSDRIGQAEWWVMSREA